MRTENQFSPERPARKVPVSTERALSNPLKTGTYGDRWVVLAERTTNKGTRYEFTAQVPAFYLSDEVTNRKDARKEAALILGADLPGAVVRFEVHRTV